MSAAKLKGQERSVIGSRCFKDSVELESFAGRSTRRPRASIHCFVSVSGEIADHHNASNRYNLWLTNREIVRELAICLTLSAPILF